MKRLIDYHLAAWKVDSHRKSLLLRGARQVGKTHAVRQLGATFGDFVEINFELQPAMIGIFEVDLQPKRILQELSVLVGRPIIPGVTLLFFDEIQAAPKAVLALRYFYELMPELHVIAAGSLLDFTLEEIGMPVGRVASLYVYPMSFLEFVVALDKSVVAQYCVSITPEVNVSDPIHTKLLQLVSQYLAIGGMPEAVSRWRETNDVFAVQVVHQTLVDAYRQDFAKYATKFQIPYVSLLFDQAPLQLGGKFKYSALEGDWRKRELAPCLDLLVSAGVVHKVFRSAGNGIPLGAESDPGDFKIVFLDVALAQTILGFNIGQWIAQSQEQFVNKGELVESFVGQELLAYESPVKKGQLFYWRRDERGSQAEVDYLVQEKEHIVPIEVKSGAGSTLKSMHLFLQTHAKSPQGLRFSIQPPSRHEKILSYPLYAVASALHNKEQLNSLFT